MNSPQWENQISWLIGSLITVNCRYLIKILLLSQEGHYFLMEVGTFCCTLSLVITSLAHQLFLSNQLHLHWNSVAHVKIIRNFPKVLTCMTQFCYLNAIGFIWWGDREGAFLGCFFKVTQSYTWKEWDFFFISCVSTDNGVPTQAGTIPKMIITHAYQIAEHLIWDFWSCLRNLAVCLHKFMVMACSNTQAQLNYWWICEEKTWL